MPDSATLRLLDLGLVAPAFWHKTYQYLAETLPADGNPILLCGRTPAHFCLGAHQGQALELTAECTVPVLQRPLGGGGVWLDEQQLLLVLILPSFWISGKRPAQWFDALLHPMSATYAAFQIESTRVAHDLWHQGRKLAGSGAASISSAGLVASSFLFRFPADQFAACIAAPSNDFRLWLKQALDDSITDWHKIGTVPAKCELMQALQHELHQHLQVEIEQSRLSLAETAAIENYQPDEDEIYPSRQRLVPHGIKLNARRFLTERHFENGEWVRVQTHNGKLERLALSLPLPDATVATLCQGSPEPASLTAVLQPHTTTPTLWAERILQTAYFETE